MKTFMKTSGLHKLGSRIINIKGFWLIIFLMILSCDKKEVSPNLIKSNAAFLSFSAAGQTLPTFISDLDKQIKLEVAHSVDVTQLVPAFDVPSEFSVYANGVKQLSGSSSIDLSNPVTYELRDSQNKSTSWNVSVIPLGCKILVDASHDGGVWWFPQYAATGFNADQPHQGQAFANLLRDKGFEVTELGRDKELTEEMFFGNYIVIRANGLEKYTPKEINVYTKLIDRGMNLAFFTDHKMNDPADELGDLLGIQFKGVANGEITNFATHEITDNIVSLDYIAGSVVTNADSNPNIKILGWLRPEDFADLNFNGVKDGNEPSAPPVMGVLNYPKSKIFFIGDTNGLEGQSQPFVDNLIHWMGECVLD